MIGKLITPEQIRAKGYGAWKYVRLAKMSDEAGFHKRQQPTPENFLA